MPQAVELISGSDFRRMIAGAYRTFMREHEYINNLNVFPVPDGDTGTNMLLTLGAVAKALGDITEGDIGAASKRAADSAIMGARGNSGVILSQLFRGIARGLAGKEQATSSGLGKAFQYGVLYAYRAVTKPVEGTILTVAKGIAKGAHQAVRDGRPFADILIAAIAAGESELQRTPELLPALKAAGVVDAGGYGLLVFLRGCLDGLNGEYAGPESEMARELILADGVSAEVVHPYCTEFIVKPCSITVKEARRVLSPLGDSLIVAEGTELLKVHIHTAQPGRVLESAITWGTLHDIKIDNMADQKEHHAGATGKVPAGAKPAALICVAAGEGLTAMLRELGADFIITGGQTMNPSVEDMVDVIHTGKAERYILLPNNKNIVLAATQVQKLLPDRVSIVPTVNIPQGMAALLAFDPQQDVAANVRRMTEAAAQVRAAAVTVAVRDSHLGEELVPAGSYIGVIEHQVLVQAPSLQQAVTSLLQAIVQPEDELVSLYYGEGVTADEAQQIVEQIGLPQAEIQLYYGGQPHYLFLVSVE